MCVVHVDMQSLLGITGTMFTLSSGITKGVVLSATDRNGYSI